MFNLQGSEIIIILLLALVVLGPEKLPDAMRRAGQLYAELKKMSSGFQQEFRAAVDEPLKEMRDTANMLRDSADFTKLQEGERDEKPKSADMIAPADPEAVPVEEVPTFDTGAAADERRPEPTPETKRAPDPFASSQNLSAAPTGVPPTSDDAAAAPDGTPAAGLDPFASSENLSAAPTVETPSTSTSEDADDETATPADEEPTE